MGEVRDFSLMMKGPSLLGASFQMECLVLRFYFLGGFEGPCDSFCYGLVCEFVGCKGFISGTIVGW